MIVTVTPTVRDGSVVRWYRDDAAETGREIVSASRYGVHIPGYLHEVPADVLSAAKAAWAVLRSDPNADASHLATHRRRGLFGPLEPVPPRSPSTESETPGD